MLDAGGGGGYSGPFHHFGPAESTVESDGDVLIDRGGEICNVAQDVYQQELEAARGTDGPLLAPLTAANSRVYRRTLELKDASVYAGGCVRKFGNAIGIHDRGVDGLNTEYWQAYANDFGVAEIDWDRNKGAQRDPEGAEADRQAAIGRAESALMAELRRREGELRETLDGEADSSASMLDQGPSEDRMMSLFQAGDLPIMATQMFPGYDFSRLDMREMLEELWRKGDLPPGVDIDQVMAALDDIDKILDGELFDAGGPRLRQLLADLQDMAPGSFDFIVLGLDDDELRRLDEVVTDDNPLFGLGHWGTIDFHSLFLASGSTATLWRLKQNWPSIEPSLEGVDAIEDGDLRMPRWGDPPPGGLFRLDGDGNPIVSAGDVDQGMVGNCWMQAKMAALAQEHPDWVTEHIWQNANGTISVKMYDDDGNPHVVTITDDLPVDENGTPAFSGNSGSGANWASYYEKAHALASDHGSDGEDGYGGTEGGSTDDDAMLMTGNDAEDIDNEGGFLGMGDHEDLDDVRHRVENGESVVVSTNDDDRDDIDGWVSNHVFYVKGFTDDGRVICGNPWSSNDPDMVLTEDQFNDLIDGGSVVRP